MNFYTSLNILFEINLLIVKINTTKGMEKKAMAQSTPDMEMRNEGNDDVDFNESSQATDNSKGS